MFNKIALSGITMMWGCSLLSATTTTRTLSAEEGEAILAEALDPLGLEGTDSAKRSTFTDDLLFQAALSMYEKNDLKSLDSEDRYRVVAYLEVLDFSKPRNRKFAEKVILAAAPHEPKLIFMKSKLFEKWPIRDEVIRLAQGGNTAEVKDFADSSHMAAASWVQSNKYVCGTNAEFRRPYGKVQQRVDCGGGRGDRISVSEYKGDLQHGVSIDFDSHWRRRCWSFYANGRKHGARIFWDSLGNVIGRETFRNGIQVAKREIHFAPGRPSFIKHFNSQGEEEGSWEEWWPNGNKKAEFMAKGGRIISGTEFYQNGKPRLRYVSKYEPKVRSVFKKKRIQAEAWAPDGRSAGKIVDGQGEWLLFPDGRDTTDKTVFREVYKDSLMIKGETLDSADVEKWLK